MKCQQQRDLKEQEEKKCIGETVTHISEVAKILYFIGRELDTRAIEHDNSKMNEPELAYFVKYTPKLKGTTYGSEQYKQYLKELQPALDHHYGENSHHPEHFENGIKGMNLIDLVEMFCDWLAATKRHADGDIMRSIEINKTRFNMSEDLVEILRNTAKLF